MGFGAETHPADKRKLNSVEVPWRNYFDAVNVLSLYLSFRCNDLSKIGERADFGNPKFERIGEFPCFRVPHFNHDKVHLLAFKTVSLGSIR